MRCECDVRRLVGGTRSSLYGRCSHPECNIGGARSTTTHSTSHTCAAIVAKAYRSTGLLCRNEMGVHLMGFVLSFFVVAVHFITHCFNWHSHCSLSCFYFLQLFVLISLLLQFRWYHVYVRVMCIRCTNVARTFESTPHCWVSITRHGSGATEPIYSKETVNRI